MENEAPKVEISLLLIIGFWIGITLGAGIGLGLTIVIAAGWKAAIFPVIICMIVNSINALILSAMAVWAGYKTKELVRGSWSDDFLGGILSCAFLAGSAMLIFGVGYNLGIFLSHKMIDPIVTTEAAKGIINQVVGIGLGLNLLWIVWRWLNYHAHKRVEGTNSK